MKVKGAVLAAAGAALFVSASAPVYAQEVPATHGSSAEGGLATVAVQSGHLAQAQMRTAHTRVIKAQVAKARTVQARTPATMAPVTKAPVTKAPVTKAPVTKAPVTKAPVTMPLRADAVSPAVAAPAEPAVTSRTPAIALADLVAGVGKHRKIAVAATDGPEGTAVGGAGGAGGAAGANGDSVTSTGTANAPVGNNAEVNQLANLCGVLAIAGAVTCAPAVVANNNTGGAGAKGGDAAVDLERDGDGGAAGSAAGGAGGNGGAVGANGDEVTSTGDGPIVVNAPLANNVEANQVVNACGDLSIVSTVTCTPTIVTGNNTGGAAGAGGTADADVDGDGDGATEATAVGGAGGTGGTAARNGDRVTSAGEGLLVVNAPVGNNAEVNQLANLCGVLAIGSTVTCTPTVVTGNNTGGAAGKGGDADVDVDSGGDGESELDSAGTAVGGAGGAGGRAGANGDSVVSTGAGLVVINAPLLNNLTVNQLVNACGVLAIGSEVTCTPTVVTGNNTGGAGAPGGNADTAVRAGADGAGDGDTSPGTVVGGAGGPGGAVGPNGDSVDSDGPVNAPLLNNPELNQLVNACGIAAIGSAVECAPALLAGNNTGGAGAPGGNADVQVVSLAAGNGNGDGVNGVDGPVGGQVGGVNALPQTGGATLPFVPIAFALIVGGSLLWRGVRVLR